MLKNLVFFAALHRVVVMAEGVDLPFEVLVVATGAQTRLIFAAGTIAGMMLITAIIAVPITYSANRFQSFNRYVGAATGAFSMAFGLFLVYQTGFVNGLLR